MCDGYNTVHVQIVFDMLLFLSPVVRVRTKASPIANLIQNPYFSLSYKGFERHVLVG